MILIHTRNHLKKCPFVILSTSMAAAFVVFYLVVHLATIGFEEIALK